MRCPKCGYNSFDYLDSCKKCGKDLTEHKQRFGIVSVLFPGQVEPQEAVAPLEDESSLEEAVAVATAAATAEVQSEAEENVAPEPPSEESGEGADFGFDFMGDSEEEEDLSFDELFEEAPSDEDVEESLPSPEEEAGDEFAFDLDDAETDAVDEAELESDFGFDPASEGEEKAADDFSFEPDDVSFEKEEDAGAEEDPKDPFDLPESAPAEQAPETTSEHYRQGHAAEAEIAARMVAEELGEGDGLADSITEPAVSFAPGEVVDEPEPIADVPSPEVRETFAAETESSVEQPAAEEQRAAGPAVSFAALQSKAAVTAESARDDKVSIAETPKADSPPVPPVAEDVPENAAAEKSPAAAEPLVPATGSRVLAFACDLLLLTLVGVSFVIAAEAAISPSGGLLPSTESLIDLSIPYFLVLFSLAFGYFTLFHFLAGQTPGKMLAGLRVETIGGEPLLFSQAFLRSVGGLLQLLPAGLGYLAVFSSVDRRGWNDQLAGTRLVSLRGALEEA